MTLAYLDASALVKLAVEEPESLALAAELQQVDTVAISIVGRVELGRALRRRSGDGLKAALDSAARVLDGVMLIPLDVATAAVATSIAPTHLRTLDAIHLATVIALESELDCCYCYDHRLADAITERGMPVAAPGT